MDQPLRLVSQPTEAMDVSATQRRSFEEFFEAEWAGLYGALWLITRNRHEAEDLTQEAFVRVLERWDRVGDMDDPTGYLYRTALNLFRHVYRRAALAAKRRLWSGRADDPIDGIDDRDVVVRALAGLSRQQRASVVLTDLLGYSSPEAAGVLGIRAATVRTHLARAHADLRKTMGETR